MTAIPAPRKAERHKVKLKICISGPSGSGKTKGALALARNMLPEGRIVVVDTENDSASLYADDFDFDVIPLDPPYTSERYIAAIKLASDYDLLILDSITHQWDGQGGILDRKNEAERKSPGSNSYFLWQSFTPEHTKFIEAIKQAPIHVIATMRSKMEYALSTNDKGKVVPQKVGMAPIQRDGAEYEFSLVFDLDMNHQAKASKDRTELFEGVEVDLLNPAVAQALSAWMLKGKDQPVVEVAPLPSNGTKPYESKRRKQEYAASESRANFQLSGNHLRCVPSEVKIKPTKNGNEVCAVKINGKVEDKNILFCFHASLFDALEACQGVSCQLELEKNGDYLNISDVLDIAGKEYRDGKPYDGLEVTDDDIPF